MRAGRLHHLVTLQRPVFNTAADGERVKTWIDVEDVYAEMNFIRGSEYLTAREQHSNITGRFKIRYRDDIDRTWRVKFEARLFELASEPIRLGDRFDALEFFIMEDLSD